MSFALCSTPTLLFVLLLWRTSSAFGSHQQHHLHLIRSPSRNGNSFNSRKSKLATRSQRSFLFRNNRHRRWGASYATVLRGGGASEEDDDTSTEPIPSVTIPDSWKEDDKQPCRRRAMIFMDQFSPYHGGYLTAVAREVYGVAIIQVLSTYMAGYFQQQHPHLMEPKSMIVPTATKEQLDRWMEHLINTYKIERIEGIYCESDSGLPDAEQLSELLNLRPTNNNNSSADDGGINNDARRDKYKMVEAAKSYGLDTVRQRICTSLEDALKYAQEELQIGRTLLDGDDDDDDATTSSRTIDDVGGVLGTGKNTEDDTTTTTVQQSTPCTCCCIVKPIRGSGSDGVARCTTLEQVEMAFQDIYGTVVFGSTTTGAKHDCVVLQEFAIGTEYALDIVSKDGQHKVAALWRYDKRPANGAPFVYFATELISATTSEAARDVCTYATNCLDALDWKWGLTHVEVILTRNGPRLVEVNCRQHNMDFLPLVMGCIGYNCFDMLLAAYLGDDDDDDDNDMDDDNDNNNDNNNDYKLNWDDLPSVPSTAEAPHGAMVHLVNFVEGKLVEINEEALLEIQSMESVINFEIYDNFRDLGTQIHPTKDIRTDAGWVQIIHQDKETFLRDYNRIVELMETLFIVELTM